MILVAIFDALHSLCFEVVDAMQEAESPVLEIRTYYDCARDEMAVRIFDNGKGMSPEEKSRLGTTFFTTKEKVTVFIIALPCINVKACKMAHRTDGVLFLWVRLDCGNKCIIKYE